jgi:L-amino acid N-acyltransferase YncA
VTVRLATGPDAEAVAALWNHYIRETSVTFNAQEKNAEEVAGLIGTRPAFFVALDHQGRVAGFATYGQFRSGVGSARTMEHTIQLAPGASGRGLGRALMTLVEDHARAGGAHSMFAGVSGENPEGRAFHARLGYVETAILPQVGWKFGRWMDLVLMQKFLA